MFAAQLRDELQLSSSAMVAARVLLCVACASGLSMHSPALMRVPAAASRAAVPVAAEHVPGETCTGERVVVVGATGYIGKAVVRESVRRGYSTTAVVRSLDRASGEPKFEGASLVAADVCDPASLASSAPFGKGSVDVVISCLASRTGSKKDSFAIDYQATLNCLEAARAAGARQFVLLSAYCVKSAERADPYALQFQARASGPPRHTPHARARPRALRLTHTSAVSHGSTRRRTSRRSCARRTT